MLLKLIRFSLYFEARGLEKIYEYNGKICFRKFLTAFAVRELWVVVQAANLNSNWHRNRAFGIQI